MNPVSVLSARWWHWLLGMILPLHTVIFELLTHQMSGSMFDPMVTLWHALMLVALPIGFGAILLSSGKGKLGLAGLVSVCFSLPLMLLIVWAIRWQHFDALLKFVFGMIYIFTNPSEVGGALFGDYYASPIAALAYLGPLSGCFVVVSLLLRRVNTSVRALCLVTIVAAFGFLTYLEVATHRLELAIASAYEDLQGEGRVKDPAPLKTTEAKDVIARLSRQGTQFSSAGTLYAVGPVDVFGPWTFIQRGRLHPVDVLFRTKWPDYTKLYAVLWPNEVPKPKSWRGLSHWEEWRRTHEN